MMLSLYLSMLETDEERRLFAERYELFKYDCQHIANSILHNPALAEDAVHEAFLAIIKKSDKYLALPCRDFKRLIVIIVRNKSLNIIQKQNRAINIAPDDPALNVADDAPGVEEQVTRLEDAQEAIDYLQGIDETSRQVLYLRYVQDMSYKEIGAELGMKEKTVEVRIARAKQKVRDLAKR